MSDHDNLDPERTIVSGHSAFGMARELKAGDVVGGNYKIKSVVGRGGMGVVYCVEHRAIHRQYALKALAPDRINTSNWQRFQAEGKAIAKLDHPNIVKVYDMGTDGPGGLYYVMDLLQGVSLAEHVADRNILGVDEALDIFSQLCAGLSYAHRQGLIHRDIKPANIILCSLAPGQAPTVVKIIDFGLVKLVGDANQFVQSQTATGQVCGSPLYMSPEQCMGSKIDARSDIYSLGCTLFECLTGEPPFRGSNGLETAFMHQNEVPPLLSDFCPDKKYPENLEQLIDRMLQKNPAQRYQSMDQVGQDLIRVREGRSVRREAIHKDEALFEIDDDDDAAASSSAEGKSVSLNVWIWLVTSIFSIGLIWGIVSYLHSPAKKQGPPSVAAERGLTKEEVAVREVFAKWPQISSGVEQRDGSSVRVFKFPDVPVGFICWGEHFSQQHLAKGEVIVPANEPVTLRLSRPEGDCARLFPDILTKIGPEDISSLEVPEPKAALEDVILLSDISPELIQSVSHWTALRRLDFYHATLKKEATLALNQLRPVKELFLRGAFVGGDDLALVDWLNRVNALDVKGVRNIDPVLHRLAGSGDLQKLVINRTTPSTASLRGLTTCKNLQSLSIAEADIDDEKLAIVCDIPNLNELWIGQNDLNKISYHHLCKLKKLTTLHVGSMAADEISALKHMLPHCSIVPGRSAILGTVSY